MTDREAMKMALEALEMHVLGFDGVRKMELAIEALETALAQPEPFKPDWVSYRQGVADGAAQPEQEEPLPLVDIGVDVTPGGTHVVACYNRPDAVQEMFYSQFHPLAKPEREPKLSDAGADTNITRGLEPKGSGMVTLNQVGMRVDLKDGTRKPWVGLTDEEQLHLAAAAYATYRGNLYTEAAKEGIAIKRTPVQIQGIWLAHYEGYREGYWVATGNEYATDPAKLKEKDNG